MEEEPYIAQLDAETKASLKMYLFRTIHNRKMIRDHVGCGIWSCAVIEPSLILDPFQVVVAVNKAVVAEKQNAMVTKSVYSEIVYNLSIKKNITESLKMFGMDRNVNILVCFIVTEENDPSTWILPQIKGFPSPMSELSELTDMKRLKKAYQLEHLPTDHNLLKFIINRIVTKQITSY